MSLVLGFCLLFTAALSLTGCGRSGAAGAVIQALRDGDAQNANQLYYEKINGKDKELESFNEQYATAINEIYNDLNAGKLAPDEAELQANRFRAFALSSDYSWLFSNVDRLINSKRMYSAADAALLAGDYASAIGGYAAVMPDDTNYSSAQACGADAYHTFVNAVLDEMSSNASSGNYGAILHLIDGATSDLSGFADIGSEKAAMLSLLERASAHYTANPPTFLGSLSPLNNNVDLFAFNRAHNEKTFSGIIALENVYYHTGSKRETSASYDVSNFANFSAQLFVKPNSDAGLNRNLGTMEIYLDGALAYRSPEMGSESSDERGPLDVLVALNGASTMEIRFCDRFITFDCFPWPLYLGNVFLSQPIEPFTERA